LNTHTFYLCVDPPKWNCYSIHIGCFMQKIDHAKVLQTSVSMILSGIPIIGRGFGETVSSRSQKKP